MAAQSLVLHSYEDPAGTYSTNVMGTVNVLESIRLAKRPCVVINVTTDKCYENQMWVWGYRENDRLGGQDPYSNSKACAELVAKAYRDSFYPMEEFNRHGVGIGSVRAGNVIGGGDWTPRQLLPDIIAACSQGTKLVLRHPTSVRPWQHVLDCLAGYLTLAEQLSADPMRYTGEWNFGPAESDAWTVADVVAAIIKEWGGDCAWEKDHSGNGHEESKLRLDCSKANHVLGWRPRLKLEESVRWIVRWYKGYLHKEDPRELCHEELRHYMALNG
jgi:CDP-glucose 4,6-dehydratase